ncbi:MAG: MFS transporter [Chloroflexi bacterium]|nr:MFS transporter [Chloroflexota bacterium]
MKRGDQGIGRTFSAMRVRNYRLFWFGQLVSLSGTWMQRVGQAWLVLRLTDSPFALGAVTALQFAPLLALSLFGGVFADRLPKRKLMVVSQAVMAVQALCLAVLTTTNQVQLWHLYVLAVVLGLANAIDNPARQSFVMEMVGPGELVNAVALNSSLFNATRILGPAVGGAITVAAGEAGCFWVNAVSYVAVIGALLAMRSSELHSVPRPIRGRLIGQLREGLAYALKTRDICVILVPLCVMGMFGFNFQTVLPLLARYVLNGDAQVYGLLFSCVGLGSIVAALRLASQRAASEALVFAGAGAFALLLLLVAFSPWFLLSAALLIVLGFAGILFSATANTRMQMVPPPELRGRVMSLYTLLFDGMSPLGSVLVGMLSERAGVQIAIASSAVLCLLGVLAGLAFARRQPSATARALEAPL